MNVTFFSSRLQLCALAVASLFLCAREARADFPPIYNNFEDGSVPFGDGFPSAANGTYGWGTAWTISSNIYVFPNVISDNPLNGGNNYVNITISNSPSSQAVRRQYTSYSSTANVPIGSSTNRNTFCVTWNPHMVSFDYRVDSYSGPVYTNEQSCVTYYVTCNNDQSSCTTNTVYSDPPPNFTVTTNMVCTNTGNRFIAYMTNVWSSRDDFAFISGSASSASASPDNSAAWIIYAQGATDTRVQGPPCPGNRWVVYDGGGLSSAAGAGRWVDTGMNFTNGTVYHFDVVTDPRDKVYFVVVTDGVTTNRTPVLRWRNFSETGPFFTPFVTYGAQTSDTNAAINFSYDTIAISQLPPELFFPRITQLSPSLYPPPPTNLASTLGYTPSFNFPRFYPASKGLTFVASTGGGGSNDLAYDNNTNYYLATAHTTIRTSGIGLVLNGTDVSGSLGFSRPFSVGSNYVRVSYNGLTPNTMYKGTIWVTNSVGAVTSQKLDFDTFDESLVRFIEAEDYNYGDGSYNRGGSGSAPTVGGMFLDDPAPSDYTGSYLNQSSGYVDRMGYITNGPPIDYFVPTNNFGLGVNATNFNTTNNVYRIADAVGTTPAADYPRTKYLRSGARDFQVSLLQPGEWMNYTRNFSNATYSVFLRASSTGTGNGGTNTVSLDLVTSDPTQPGQTTSNLGFFFVPYTGNANVFTNVPLTDGNGAVITVALSGQQTLRLTSTNANNNLQLNYVMLVPPAANTPSVTIATPADGASFSAGATVVLTAAASVPSGAISKVEYFNGSVSLGSSTASPFTVNWNSVPTGNYTIVAKATTSSGFSASSAAVRIKVGTPAKRVLYVQNLGTGTGDIIAKNMITARGWTVVVLQDTNTIPIGPEAANGFDLVVTATSLDSNRNWVNWRDISVPMIEFNNAMQGRTAETKENNTLDYAASGGRQFVLVLATNDPAAAGYTGIQSIAPAAIASCIMVPNENAVAVTTYTNAPGIWINDLYYKAGAEMCNGVFAPATRYHYLSGNFSSTFSPFASNILWAAFDVAVANPVFTGYPIKLSAPRIAGGNITIPFNAGSMDYPGSFSVWSASSVNGPYTQETGAVITQAQTGGRAYEAVTTLSGKGFYRIKRN